MKCIKSVKETKQVKLGEILRTSDEDAKEKVKGGYWVYAPKSDWKQYKGVTPKVEPVVVEKVKKGKSKKELKLERKRDK